MTLFLLMNLSLSIFLVFSKHPLSMGLILLMQTISITFISSFFTPTNWFSLILFLIMIGGMLILFMYMTNVASNKKFQKSWLTLIPVIMMFLYMTTKNNFLFFFNSPSVDVNFIINKYISIPTNFLMILLILYLFITLIASVKIINFKNTPFRLM